MAIWHLSGGLRTPVMVAQHILQGGRNAMFNIDNVDPFCPPVEPSVSDERCQPKVTQRDVKGAETLQGKRCRGIDEKDGNIRMKSLNPLQKEGEVRLIHITSRFAFNDHKQIVLQYGHHVQIPRK